MTKLAAAVLVAFIALALPDALYAWTPGTHVVLGERVLGSLHLLPATVAELLRAFPYDFLYGSIAADTTMAKKYAPADRHCHAWHVGREVHAMADSDSLQAFGLGYLAHLAADVVAHNHFVPRQLVVTSSTTTMGHTYWESRVENALGGLVPRAARELIRLDHRAADAHLERILSPTIFSVRTNRRLFRGMVRVADSRPWQLGMQVATEQSRWDITDESVEGYLAQATRAIRVALSDDDADIYQEDPNGEAAILRSKSVRREAVRRIGRRDPDELAQVADAEFGIGPSADDSATG